MYKFIDDKGQHLHTYEGKPLKGCTTVCGIIAKVLTWWASGMALSHFGWLDPKKNSPKAVNDAIEAGYKKVQGLSPAEYHKLVSEAYKAHSVKLKDSAQTGTDLHAELERFVKNTMENRMATYDDRILPFIEWSKKNVKKFLWSEIHAYSIPMWTGAILDVGWIDMQDRLIAGDFKSSPKTYLTHFVQIAGGDMMLSENGGFTADGEKILDLPKPIDGYCIIPFGKEVPEPEFVYDVEAYKNGFKFANGLYDLDQQFQTTK